MGNFKILKYTIPLLVFLFLNTACSQSTSAQGQTDYDKLCKIHEVVMKKPISPIMQSMEIADRVQKEIPDVYVHFENIANADPKDAYQLFKKVAEKETNKPWDCQIMQDFYSGNLKSQNK